MLVPITAVEAWIDTQNTDNPSGWDLPTYAKKYYDNNGNLVGAVVQDPNQVSTCICDNNYNPEDYLPSVRFKQIDNGILVQQFEHDDVVDTKFVSIDELATYLGSSEKVNQFLNEERINRQVNRFDDELPIEPSPDWFYPSFYWVKEHSEVVDHVWTNVAQLYSGRLLENHMRLKMSTGTQTVTSLSWGSFTYGSSVTYSKYWVTDLYAAPWQTFTIRMMMDYTYEYWQQYVSTGWGTYPAGSKQIWWCSAIRGGTLELSSPYPDLDRTKTYSDDSVSLNPGQTKEVVYNQLSTQSYSYDIAVELKATWWGGGGELKVPIISYSSMSSHYSSTEVVYTFTSHANYYHIWDIYEYGRNYGTNPGYVLTFDIYQ